MKKISATRCSCRSSPGPGAGRERGRIARTRAGENATPRTASTFHVRVQARSHQRAPHISSDADYGAFIFFFVKMAIRLTVSCFVHRRFIRDAVGDGGGDMGPQLDGPGDGNSGFVAVGGGGALGYMGELGIAETSMRRSMDDAAERSRATRASYSRQTMERAPWLDGAAGEGPAPRRGVRHPSTPSAARAAAHRARAGAGRRLSTTTATRVCSKEPVAPVPLRRRRVRRRRRRPGPRRGGHRGGRRARVPGDAKRRVLRRGRRGD